MPKRFTILAGLSALAFSSPAHAIKQGSPATAFPEAVVLTANGFIPCSGVLIAPAVVLTAGHCSLGATADKSYDVVAPNALDSSGKPQSAHASRDWTPYDNDVKTTSDVRLVFLDSPISIAMYPTIPAAKVVSGTKVVDIGRTLNGTKTQTDYVSGEVVISNDGTSLGLPLNYQALPDVSEDGDSGGPIELADGTHTLVALVDTDTVEQGIAETTPIDLFVRLDLVRDQIISAMASPADSGAGGADAGSSAPLQPATSSSGCAVGARKDAGDLLGFSALLAAGLAASKAGRSRRHGKWRGHFSLYAIGFNKNRSAR